MIAQSFEMTAIAGAQEPPSAYGWPSNSLCSSPAPAECWVGGGWLTRFFLSITIARRLRTTPGRF